jgi:hypothetical protein
MILVAAALCGVLPVAGCGPAGTPVTETWEGPAGWREVLGSPLSPREAALGLWTGHEVLLIGGTDSRPCPPNASCAESPTPLSDGAALDPGTSHWRRIADSPVPVQAGVQGVVVGSAAYVLRAPPQAAGRELLVYRIDQDSWTRMPVPFDTAAGYRLLAAGDRLVAYVESDETHESGPGKDYVLDPRTANWTSLSADPLGAGSARAMAWTGPELVLFDHALVADPGADEPPFTRAAALNLATGSWRRLPDSTILSTYPWLWAGDKLVNPTLGGEDGGEVGNWGRVYPNGGSLAPTTGEWAPLPNPPAGSMFGAGAYTDANAVYFGGDGAVLDTTTGSWQSVPTVPGGNVTGRTVVAAGVRMLVFGGAQWKASQSGGTLLDDVWIWAPGA